MRTLKRCEEVEGRQKRAKSSMASPIQKYVYALLVPTHTSTLQRSAIGHSVKQVTDMSNHVRQHERETTSKGGHLPLTQFERAQAKSCKSRVHYTHLSKEVLLVQIAGSQLQKDVKLVVCHLLSLNVYLPKIAMLACK